MCSPDALILIRPRNNGVHRLLKRMQSTFHALETGTVPWGALKRVHFCDTVRN